MLGMRTIFLRIFVWFWLAMAVVAGILVVSSPLFTRSRPAVERWQRSAEDVLLHRAREVAEAIGREGVGVFDEQHLRRRRDGREHRLRVHVFTPDGTLVGGDEAPDDVREFARAGGESFERRGALYLATVPATAPDGGRYQVVVGYLRPPRLVDLLEPRILAPRLLALVLVAGLLTFWLARYVSAPVAALRQATRRLSHGELSARVGGKIARRRDEIGDLARDFDAMADRIEALVASQRRLVSDVSHELRSPLARLSVALELARQQAGGEAERPLDRIEREAERLNELVGQLLLLSRLESAAAGEEVEEFDLAAVALEVAEDVEFETGGGRVRAIVAGPFRMRGEASLVRSAVENVVRNAVRYSPDGGEVEVRLELPTAGGDAVLSVRDRGPGVPEEALGALFEPFFRVDDARDRQTGGTGLGLAIAARAVRLHGGRIVAANHRDGGLVVTMTFPSARSAGA